MPLTHLTRVDLPAPWSPTGAVTSSVYTSSPTSCRTWTGPKLLSIPRSSRRGVAATDGSPSLGDRFVVALPLATLRGCPHGVAPPTPRGRERRLHSADRGEPEFGPGQLMPLAVQSAAYEPVQSWSLVTKPSATTSLTEDLVIDFGTNSTDGIEAPDSGSLVVPVAVVGF